MTFRYDPHAALAQASRAEAAPATPARAATPDVNGAGNVAGIAAVARARSRETENHAADPDSFAEAAALLEYDHGLPRPDAERAAAAEQGFASAADLRAAAAAGWARELEALERTAWEPKAKQALAAALAFTRDGWAEKALALGWGELELVGADPRAPWERLDRLGAAYSRHAPSAVTAEAIIYRDARGVAMRHLKGSQSLGAALPWEGRE